MRRLPNFRDEHGFALVMALGSLVVLSIVLTVALEVSSSSNRHANRTNADEKAYRLAEAGLNNAVAVIAEVGADTTKVKPQPTVAGDPNSTTQSLTGGTVTWGGTYDAATKVWTIKSIGSVKNPAGVGSAAITRTATGKIADHPAADRLRRAELDDREAHTDHPLRRRPHRQQRDLRQHLERRRRLRHQGQRRHAQGHRDLHARRLGDGGQLGPGVGRWHTVLTSRQAVLGADDRSRGAPSRARRSRPTRSRRCRSRRHRRAPGRARPPTTPPGTTHPPRRRTAPPERGTTIHSKGGAGIAVNDVILVESEYMQVTGVVSEGRRNYALAVTRGYLNTANVTHNAPTTSFRRRRRSRSARRRCRTPASPTPGRSRSSPAPTTAGSASATPTASAQHRGELHDDAADLRRLRAGRRSSPSRTPTRRPRRSLQRQLRSRPATRSRSTASTCTSSPPSMRAAAGRR